MPKNTSNTIKKYYTILTKIKICISELIAKILLKQQSLNNSDTF